MFSLKYDLFALPFHLYKKRWIFCLYNLAYFIPMIFQILLSMFHHLISVHNALLHYFLIASTQLNTYQLLLFIDLICYYNKLGI